MDNLITIKELSKKMSLAPSTCLTYIKRYGMPSYRVRRKHLVSFEECIAWLKNYQTVQQTVQQQRDFTAIINRAKNKYRNK